MPAQDGTGPTGQGPMTGRGLGPCGNGLARARGFRRGFGPGRCFRQGFMQPQVITESQEKEMLKQELENIKQEQTEIETRLKEIK